MFGKMVVRWGYGKCRFDLDGDVTTGRYEVIASDDDSVVIRLFGSVPGAGRLLQVHFEGDNRYWIRCDVNFSECFKRLVTRE
jgi:hypothetical protein